MALDGEHEGQRVRVRAHARSVALQEGCQSARCRRDRPGAESKPVMRTFAHILRYLFARLLWSLMRGLVR